MKVRLVSVAMLFTLLCALVIVPVGTASAKPKPGKGNNSLKNVKAKGKFGDATVAVTQFSVNSAGKLVASGKVTHAKKGEVGSFSDVPVTVRLSQSVSAAGAGFAAQQQQETCEILTLTLGPIFLNLLGLVVQTTEINLVITGETGEGNLLGNLLCGIAGLLDDPNGLSQLLNYILALLGGSLTGGSPLTGVLPISIASFGSQNGELVANFYVNRTDGSRVGPFAAPAQVIEPPEGSCEILTLVLGPLDLNLLGLRIQLFGENEQTPITILIYAVPGPGNLLGNLLCGIVGLLDRDAPAAAVASKLNQVLKVTG